MLTKDMSSSEPLVSIIIPVYNRSHLIGETLESVISQLYQNWECIVVDDGSEDFIDELMNFYCEKDSRFLYYHRPKDLSKGANACRNFGLDLAKGKYINWFDSDDIMHPNKLEKQIRLFEKSDVSLVICKTLEFYHSIQETVGDRYTFLKSKDHFDDFITGKIKWLTQAPLWKKSFLIEKKLRFDETLHAGQDWEFHVRALKEIRSYLIAENVLVYLRKHNFSITNDSDLEKVRWNYFIARFKVYEEFKGEMKPSTAVFLQNYFVANYKGCLRSNFPITAAKMWKKYFIKERELPLIIKIKLFTAFFTFLLLGKGDFLIGGLDIKN